VQKRASKLITELSDLKYEVRLEKLGLTTKETRRLKRSYVGG